LRCNVTSQFRHRQIEEYSELNFVYYGKTLSGQHRLIFFSKLIFEYWHFYAMVIVVLHEYNHAGGEGGGWGGGIYSFFNKLKG